MNIASTLATSVLVAALAPVALAARAGFIAAEATPGGTLVVGSSIVPSGFADAI